MQNGTAGERDVNVAAAGGGAAAVVAAVETAMAADLSLDSTTYADEMYDLILDYDLFERFNERIKQMTDALVLMSMRMRFRLF